MEELLRLALEEDVGPGDLTTEACIAPDARSRGEFLAKQDLVVSCGDVPGKVFHQLGEAHYEQLVPDGERVSRGTVFARAEGPTRVLLTGERLALNFLMRCCGIATHTRRVVEAAGQLRVVDTRKTTPLHRALEKRAVRDGGGRNHRFALYDGVMIKDNHIVSAGGITNAVRRCKERAHPLVRIEVEVSDLAGLDEAIAAGADIVMLDNMSDEAMRAAVDRAAGRVMLEASGNMNAQRIAAIQDIGLSYVSMGGLIHQATWADISFKLRGA